MRLGKRLEQLKSMVDSGYDHIWDCCCDHGLLGAALLAECAAPNVHFVDIVSELMQQLEQKLKRFFPRENASQNHSQWHVYCEDISNLQPQELGGKHLIIIAGVGGNLISEFVKNILTKNPTTEIDFLLCPTLHQYTLRQQLIALDLRLKSEVLIADKNRYYEILLVSNLKNSSLKVSATGESIWQAKNAADEKMISAYLLKTLAHYNRVQLNSQLDVRQIIDAYSSVKFTS
ncbi:tRNA (adenine(22)-N(1))-methyltransferase [Cellvibrio sp.]|uniref:tRNA (adenine(22)-N(1))-methyltransferase n=1 Tax=Cellvibrio sp. TaxID=1965322 RepID=UPI0039648570